MWELSPIKKIILAAQCHTTSKRWTSKSLHPEPHSTPLHQAIFLPFGTTYQQAAPLTFLRCCVTRILTCLPCEWETLEAPSLHTVHLSCSCDFSLNRASAWRARGDLVLLYTAHLAENYYSALQVPTDGFIFHCY
jgi:hypothetical protein